MLTICLITLGDPATLTGGYRYHRRMAELAARNDARLTFASLPPRLPFRHGRRVLRPLGHDCGDFRHDDPCQGHQRQR